MASKQIHFFATSFDIEPIVNYMESMHSLRYYRAGMFDERISTSITSLVEIPDFAKPVVGDWNRDAKFIILSKEEQISIRDVPQRSGNIKYAIDQMANPRSASIHVGGIYKDGILLAGSFGIINSNDFSNAIFKAFSTKMKKDFQRVGNFYVGKDAMEKLNKGWRLVTNENSPREYDLRLE